MKIYKKNKKILKKSKNVNLSGSVLRRNSSNGSIVFDLSEMDNVDLSGFNDLNGNLISSPIINNRYENDLFVNVTDDNTISSKLAKGLKVNLKMLSFNVAGFQRNMEYINQLIDKYDVLFLQETWLLNDDEYGDLLKYYYPYNRYSYDAVKLPGNPGHGSGGHCFMVKKGVPAYCFHHGDSISVLKIRGTAIIGVYLPHEGKDEIKFRKSIAKMHELVKQFEENNMEVIIVGDFNSDLRRKNSRNTKQLVTFMKKFELIPYESVFDQVVDYTFFRGDQRSLIDHVLANKNSERILNVCITPYTTDNHGDHLPLEIEFIVKVDPKECRAQRKKYEPNKWEFKWHMKSFRDEYMKWINMEMINLVAEAERLKKENNANQKQKILNEIFERLHYVLREAANKARTHVHKLIDTNKIKLTPWWNPDLDEILKKSKEEYRNYKLTDDYVFKVNADVLQKKFRKMFRACKTAYELNEIIKIDRYKNKDIKQFWSRIQRKISKHTAVQIEINKLKEEFEKTFTTKLVESDDSTSNIIVRDFLNDLSNFTALHQVPQHEIKTIIDLLPDDKAIGHRNVSNEMFKYANGDELSGVLKIMFETMINDGIVPNRLNISVIKPLIKDGKKSKSDINNVRPISISDTICTILEKYILAILKLSYSNENKQFGFKQNSSCQHAIITLLEAIKSAKRQSLRAYVCLIDASKAFDKVCRLKLWCKLIGVLDPLILRLLINYYGNSIAYVLNEQECSDEFVTLLGVKQGGCLSPLLFAIYVNPLIELIGNLQGGIRLGKLMVDILLYADDIALVAPNKMFMKRMLSLVEKFGEENEIKFNGLKTQMLLFNKSVIRQNKRQILADLKVKFTLAGEDIPDVTWARYLGVILNTGRSNKHIDNRLQQVAIKLNMLSKAGFDTTGLNADSKVLLYKSFVRPLLFYGLDCFNLCKSDMDRVETTEGNTIKTSLNLYNRIHTTELFLALNMDTTVNTLMKYKLALFIRLCNNNYTRELLEEILAEGNRNIVEGTILNDVLDILELDEQSIDLAMIKSKCMEYCNGYKNRLKLIIKDNEISQELKILLKDVYLNKLLIENILQAYDMEQYET